MTRTTSLKKDDGSSAAEGDASFARVLLRERVEALYAAGLQLTWLNVIAGIIVAIVARDAPPQSLTIWCAAIAIPAFLRTNLVRQYWKSAGGGERNEVVWGWAYAASSVLAGAIWGVGVPLIAADIGVDRAIIILAVLTITVLGGLRMSLFAPAAYAYLLGCALPLLAMCVVLGVHYIWPLSVAMVAALLALGVRFVGALQVNELKYRHRHRELVQDLRRARDEAESLARARSEVLAVMSHEVRTPLTAVLGTARLMLGDPLSKQQQKRLESILHAGDALMAVLNDTLDLARIDAGRMTIEPRPVAIRPTVDNLVQVMMARAQEKGLDLAFTVDPAVPDWVEVDPDRLRQILLNLLSNAIKFTEAGRVDLAVTVSADGGGPQALSFAVTDTGVGIPEAAGKTLFRAYSQGDDAVGRRFGGTGLGLAISKRLADALGGRIGFGSEVGTGSCFWLEIPLVEAAAPATGSDQGVDTQPGHPGSASQDLTVLVVDDNPANREVATAFLARSGYHVVAAPGGAEALDIVAHRPVDAVLLDLHMPDMDGRETVRRLRASTGAGRDVPVIALTADDAVINGTTPPPDGFDSVTGKPMTPTGLMAAIEDAVKARAAAAAGRTDAVQEALDAR